MYCDSFSERLILVVCERAQIALPNVSLSQSTMAPAKAMEATRLKPKEVRVEEAWFVRKGEQFVDGPQERICERTGEQINVPSPLGVEDTVKVASLIRQERAGCKCLY